MAIADGMKESAKNVFKGSLLPLIGAAVVYLAIKTWQRRVRNERSAFLSGGLRARAYSVNSLCPFMGREKVRECWIACSGNAYIRTF